MNNRGQVGLAVFIGILFVIGAGVLAFFLSPTFRLTIIGVGFVIGSGFLLMTIINSKNRDGRVLGAVLVVFLVSVIITLLPFFGILQTGFGGSTTLSIDSANINNDELTIITASVGQGNDRYVFNFDSDDINNELSGDELVEEDINGQLILDKFNKVYDITNIGQTWYGTGVSGPFEETISGFDIDQQISFNEGLNICDNNGVQSPVSWYAIDVGIQGGPINTINIYCIFASAIAQKGDIVGTGSLDFEIDVTIEGESAVLSQENQVLSLAGGDIRLQTIGTLDSFSFLEGVDADVFLNTNGEPRWLIPNGFGNTGINSLQNFLASQTVGESREVQNPNDNIYLGATFAWSNHLSPISQQNSLNSALTDSPVVNSISFSGNKLIADTIPTGFPQIRITLDGELVGIIESSGEPDITECSNSVSFSSTQTKTTSVDVKNVGDSSGDFIASITCSSSISGQIGDPGIVNPGQTREVDISVSGVASGSDISGTCTAKITDFSSGESDSCTFGVNVNEIDTLCEPGTRRCSTNDGSIEQCNSEGSGFTILQSCSSGEQCTFNFNSNEYQCLEEGTLISPGGDSNTIQPSNGGSQFTSTQQECADKASDQPLLGWTYVASNQESCGFLCSIGLSDPTLTQTGTCEAKFVAFYILGGVLIFVISIIVFLFLRKRKGGKKRR